MTYDNSSEMKYYADFVYLNRKVKIIRRTCDDGEFLGESCQLVGSQTIYNCTEIVTLREWS